MNTTSVTEVLLHFLSLLAVQGDLSMTTGGICSETINGIKSLLFLDLSTVQWIIFHKKSFRCIKSFLYCTLLITPSASVRVEFVGTSQSTFILFGMTVLKILIFFFPFANRRSIPHTYWNNNMSHNQICNPFTFYLSGKVNLGKLICIKVFELLSCN